MSDADLSWLSLDGDEEVVWTGQPRLLGYAWTFVAGVLLLPVLGFGLALIAWAYLHATNTVYVVTSERVLQKSGILSRSVTDIGHEKIQDTSYRQSALGRHLGFGTVEVSTAGGSDVELRFRYVDDPLAVQSTLDEAARTAAGVGATAAGGEHAGTGGGRQGAGGALGADATRELVAELRGTREALEAIERQLETSSRED